jgi:hypothetical protein
MTVTVGLCVREVNKRMVSFTYLFNYNGLFNDVVNSLGYTESNDTMFIERWIGKETVLV